MPEPRLSYLELVSFYKGSHHQGIGRSPERMHGTRWNARDAKRESSSAIILLCYRHFAFGRDNVALVIKALIKRTYI